MPSLKLQILLQQIIDNVRLQTPIRWAEGEPYTSEYKLAIALDYRDQGLDDNDLSDLIDFLHQPAKFVREDGTAVNLGKRWGDNLNTLNLSNTANTATPNTFRKLKIQAKSTPGYASPGLAKLAVLHVENTSAESLTLRLPNLQHLYANDNRIAKFLADMPGIIEVVLNNNLLGYFDATSYPKLNVLCLNNNKITFFRSNQTLECLDILNNPLVTIIVAGQELKLLFCELRMLDQISLARLNSICKKNVPAEATLPHSQNTIVVDFATDPELNYDDMWHSISDNDKQRILATLQTGRINKKTIKTHLYNCLTPYLQQYWLADILMVVALYQRFTMLSNNHANRNHDALSKVTWMLRDKHMPTELVLHTLFLQGSNYLQSTLQQATRELDHSLAPDIFDKNIYICAGVPAMMQGIMHAMQKQIIEKAMLMLKQEGIDTKLQKALQKLNPQHTAPTTLLLTDGDPSPISSRMHP